MIKIIIDIIISILVLPIFYGMIVFKRYQESLPHYDTYNEGSLKVMYQLDSSLNVKVIFSKDGDFNGKDCVSFKFQSKDYVDIYFIPPDTLHIEGPCKIISTDQFKITNVGFWPFDLKPRNDYCKYVLTNIYEEYRDSVLLTSKNYIRLNDFYD